jgi:hypothetical protein
LVGLVNRLLLAFLVLVVVATHHQSLNRVRASFRRGASFAPPSRGGGKPAALVTAQMESGLVATFLIYPVGDIAENRHRVVIQYRREDLINWRQKSFVICLERFAIACTGAVSLVVYPDPRLRNGWNRS